VPDCLVVPGQSFRGANAHHVAAPELAGCAMRKDHQEANFLRAQPVVRKQGRLFRCESPAIARRGCKEHADPGGSAPELRLPRKGNPNGGGRRASLKLPSGAVASTKVGRATSMPEHPA
jgi:hypothetical protein